MARVLRRIRCGLLRARLATKLGGLSAVLLVTSVLIVAVAHVRAPDSAVVAAVAIAALGLSLLLHGALVRLALRPLREIEAVADRVRQGDFAARVPPSLLADPDIARLGATLNGVLEVLAADRAQTRRFAADAVREGEETRAGVGRALHESAAQTLAALIFQLAAASSGCADPSLHAELDGMRAVAREALQEVLALSARLHSPPRVVLDLVGLG